MTTEAEDRDPSKSETPGATPPAEPDEVPTDEQLDVEGPNESGPGHHPTEGDAA